MDLFGFIFFFILERVCFLVVKLFIQAYYFHKAGSPLRLAYSSSLYWSGLLCSAQEAVPLL